MKKKLYQRWWFWIIVIVLISPITSKMFSEPQDSEPPTTEITEPDTVPTTPDSESMPAEGYLSFELIAGEEGEYGELFTINRDTEFEETYYIYRVPVGIYTITNIGEYLSQITVASDEIIVNEAGWEEAAEVFYAKAFMVGESDTVEIIKDTYIEIHEPASFVFELISVNTHDEKYREESKEEANADPEPEPEDELTFGQINALLSAESYLSFAGFSYEGLINQLKYEGYTDDEATYAADKCGADWNKQALRSADSYLSFTAFSYSGLINQLKFDKYTPEQATYAADNCGADWFEQAAKSARNYLSFTSFSRQGLISQLEFDGFTHEQAEYGVKENGY